MRNNDDNDNNNNEKLRYEKLAGMVNFNEQLRWTKFNNSIVFNSILLIAWATIYSSSVPGKSLVLVLICLFGAGLSIFWSAMGKRTSSYLDLFNEAALEAEENLFEGKAGPITVAETLRPNTKFYQSSKFVVTYVPYFMAALYVILIPISLWSEIMNIDTIIAEFPTWDIVWKIAVLVGITALVIVMAAVMIGTTILIVRKWVFSEKYMKQEESMWVYKKMVEGIVEKLLDNLEKVDNAESSNNSADNNSQG